jgi:hypothetical protein
MTRWYYSQEGRTHGPVTADEIKDLLAQGVLRPADPIWEEGGEPKPAAGTETVLDVSRTTRVQPATPDWLDDVAALESSGPVPPPEVSHEIPDWLDDLRIWYELEAPPAPPPAAPAPATPPPLPAAPADKTVRETGFDPKTGRIHDANQFRRWLRQKDAARAQTGGPTNLSLMEAFHQGRVAIDRWVDDEAHRHLVRHGELTEMENSAGVLDILDRFAGYGPVLRERLLQRLAFTVENRRKYYAAIESL